MELLREGFEEAWRLVTSGDREVFHAAFVTLLCSLSATTLAALAAFPYGAWLGQRKRRGEGLQAFVIRVGMFTPTVVVGLLVYAVLTRRGILGGLDLLYTRTAIVTGEFFLAFPLIAVITHGASASLDARVVETARTLGAGHLRTLLALLGEMRVALAGAWLAGLARCLSELGVAITVGGNLRMRTRTLASTTTLELSRGDFGKGLACGLLLLVPALAAAYVAYRLSRESRS